MSRDPLIAFFETKAKRQAAAMRLAAKKRLEILAACLGVSGYSFCFRKAK
jgi:hypothetical protein